MGSTSEILAEEGNARVWGGMYWRNTTEVGTALGSRVGKYTATHLLNGKLRDIRQDGRPKSLTRQRGVGSPVRTLVQTGRQPPARPKLSHR